MKLREIPFDDALIEGIWRIYNECPIRQGKRFPHYGMPLEKVRPYAGTFLDRSIFIGAFLGEVLIGFAKLTIDQTQTQAGLMHIISMIEHRDKAPTNALIAQAVRSCADRHVPYLIYSNFAYGNKQNDSLSDFKRHMGFQRVNVPRYYVPLTALGGVAFRMGLHRKLVDWLPEPVIARLRDFRASRYRGSQRSSGGDKLKVPGIVGLITKLPRSEAERQLQKMMKALHHEDFYTSGTLDRRIAGSLCRVDCAATYFAGRNATVQRK